MKNSIKRPYASVLLAMLITIPQFVYADVEINDEPLERAPVLAKQLFYPNGAETAYTMRISDVLGVSVENPEGKKIGTVRDVVAKQSTAFLKDSDMAAVTGKQPTEFNAIISIGGFLGIGEKDISVPFQDLMIKRIKGVEHLVYPAGKKQLQAMSAFQYPEL